VRVGDTQGSHQRIERVGAKFKDQPHVIARMSNHDAWMTFFPGPGKNLLAIDCD